MSINSSSQITVRYTPEIAFFPDGPDTPTPVSKLAKDLEALSPYPRWTDAANNDTALIPRTFKMSSLYTILWTGSLHLEYAIVCRPVRRTSVQI